MAELNAAGVRLQAIGDKLRVDAPAGVLTPKLKAMLIARKTELLSSLIAPRCDTAGSDRAAHFSEHAPGLLNRSKRRITPAESIVATCQSRGVGLRIDEATGDLVVGKAGARANEPSQPWPSLVRAIEAHLEPVAALVKSGWTLKAGFPTDRMAA